MAIEDKYTSYRIYIVAIVIFTIAIAIAIKLTNIQWVEGNYYRKLAKERSIKTFVIPANKGNIYSADGSLLATSIPNYEIRFDALAPTQENFEQHIKSLADSLGVLLNKPSRDFLNEFRQARADKNRYFLVARDLSYSKYAKIKQFPLFNLGAYKGGIIVEQKTVREHPIGKIAERTIGYERKDENGLSLGKGIEWAFRHYLNGSDGKILKQKIAKGQWKPIRDLNEIDPQDGYDVLATIDVFIQDIAHHALLKQLEDYQADHGCVVVMETQTGYIKAISNLGRTADGSYYETINYAVSEAYEPGSTFKLVDMIALLDDKKVDTTQVYNTFGGEITYKNKKVRDSHEGGYGKISLAKGFQVSSNTVMVQAVYENYKSNPSQFTDRIHNLNLDKPLGLSLKGEGQIFAPTPSDKNWSAISLPWMAFGYGVSLTPMQVLTLYNAVANDGKMIKPLFVSEIKEWNKSIRKYEPQVLNPSICSKETLKKLKSLLENVIKSPQGTGHSLYSKDFSMAGKTGTSQANYAQNEGADKHYVSSFAGFFPVEKPKYSCVVVIHKPNTAQGYYGADVAGPVFKKIAQKIFTDSPTTNEIQDLNKNVVKQQKSYQKFYAKTQEKLRYMPNVVGMPAMDALALLEKQGLKVRLNGIGKVKKQSLAVGETIIKNTIIVLELS